jgi:hypothetical protein
MTRDVTSTVERAVEAEAVLRRVNDDIEASAATHGAGEATFLCECDDPSCHAAVELSLDDYRSIRSHPTYFLVAAGHEGDDGSGRVVKVSLRSSVVERIGYAGALAAAAYRD